MGLKDVRQRVGVKAKAAEQVFGQTGRQLRHIALQHGRDLRTGGGKDFLHDRAHLLRNDFGILRNTVLQRGGVHGRRHRFGDEPLRFLGGEIAAERGQQIGEGGQLLLFGILLIAVRQGGEQRPDLFLCQGERRQLFAQSRHSAAEDRRCFGRGGIIADVAVIACLIAVCREPSGIAGDVALGDRRHILGRDHIACFAGKRGLQSVAEELPGAVRLKIGGKGGGQRGNIGALVVPDRFLIALHDIAEQAAQRLFGQVQPDAAEQRRDRLVVQGGHESAQVVGGQHGAHVHVREVEGAEVERAEVELGQIHAVCLEQVFDFVLVHCEQLRHIRLFAVFVFVVKPFAGEHVRVGVVHLCLDDLGFSCRLHHVSGQRSGVADADLRRLRAVAARLGNAHDPERFGVLQQVFDIFLVAAVVCPNAVLLVVGVERGGRQQAEFRSQNLIIAIAPAGRHGGGFLSLCKRADQLVQLLGVFQPQHIERHIGDLAARRQRDHAFVAALRPLAGFERIVFLRDRLVLRQLKKGVGVGKGGIQPVGGAVFGREAQRVEHRARVHLPVAVAVDLIDARRHVVAVFDRLHVAVDVAVAAFKVGFERFEVIGRHAREHGGDGVPLADRLFVLRHVGVLRLGVLACGDHRRNAQIGVGDLQRIVLQAVLLHIADVGVRAVGEGQNQRDADDADGAGKRNQDRPRLFCPQVVERKRQRRQQRHGGFAHVFVNGLLRLGRIGVGVGGDLTVL